MAKFIEKIKDEIKEEVADIIYEKAKAEVKAKIKRRYQRFIDKTLTFFGFSQSQEQQRVQQIGKEIKEDKNIVNSDSVIGITELFTVKYTRSLIELASTTMGGVQDVKPKQNK